MNLLVIFLFGYQNINKLFPCVYWNSILQLYQNQLALLIKVLSTRALSVNSKASSRVPWQHTWPHGQKYIVNSKWTEVYRSISWTEVYRSISWTEVYRKFKMDRSISYHGQKYHGQKSIEVYHGQKYIEVYHGQKYIEVYHGQKYIVNSRLLCSLPGALGSQGQQLVTAWWFVVLVAADHLHMNGQLLRKLTNIGQTEDLELTKCGYRINENSRTIIFIFVLVFWFDIYFVVKCIIKLSSLAFLYITKLPCHY